MAVEKHSHASCVIRDRFILTLGGQNKKGLCDVEVHDTCTNTWFTANNLPEAVYNASAVVIVSRHIYLMPGTNPGCYKKDHAIISYLDTGSS